MFGTSQVLVCDPSVPAVGFGPVPRDGVPGLFCWTKMGVEAGQDLGSIIRRKELERQAGDGVFVWGIGNSVGTTIREVVHEKSTVPILFSPIHSKPRIADSKPPVLIVWLSYIDDRGDLHELPKHALVTSRGDDRFAGAQKRHYALLCHSHRSLLDDDTYEVDFSELRNASTNKGLGFSQVTALVRRVARNGNASKSLGRKYQVPFQAELFSPYCVRLADGVVMPANLAGDIANKARNANASEWSHFVHDLRALARHANAMSTPLLNGPVFLGQ